MSETLFYQQHELAAEAQKLTVEAATERLAYEESLINLKDKIEKKIKELNLPWQLLLAGYFKLIINTPAKEKNKFSKISPEYLILKKVYLKIINKEFKILKISGKEAQSIFSLAIKANDDMDKKVPLLKKDLNKLFTLFDSISIVEKNSMLILNKNAMHEVKTTANENGISSSSLSLQLSLFFKEKNNQNLLEFKPDTVKEASQLLDLIKDYSDKLIPLEESIKSHFKSSLVFLEKEVDAKRLKTISSKIKRKVQDYLIKEMLKDQERAEKEKEQSLYVFDMSKKEGKQLSFASWDNPLLFESRRDWEAPGGFKMELNLMNKLVWSNRWDFLRNNFGSLEKEEWADVI